MQFSDDKSFNVLVHHPPQTPTLTCVFRIQNDTEYL